MLYLTIAIIAGRYVQHSGARATIFLAMSAMLVMIGASRVYLGVHYATDVVSGITLKGAVMARTATLLVCLVLLGGLSLAQNSSEQSGMDSSTGQKSETSGMGVMGIHGMQDMSKMHEQIMKRHAD